LQVQPTLAAVVVQVVAEAGQGKQADQVLLLLVTQELHKKH